MKRNDDLHFDSPLIVAVQNFHRLSSCRDGFASSHKDTIDIESKSISIGGGEWLAVEGGCEFRGSLNSRDIFSKMGLGEPHGLCSFVHNVRCHWVVWKLGDARTA